MLAFSRCIASLVLLVGRAAGARIAKSRARAKAGTPETFHVAGVPVFNYRAGDVESLDEASVDEWVLVVKPGVTDAQIQDMCQIAKNGCKLVGNPSKGGVPFLEMHGSLQDVEAVVEGGRGAVRYVEPDHSVQAIPELAADDQETLWGLERVGAHRREREGAGVNVFVLDTGVRDTHQDFGGRVIPTLDVSGGTVVECNGESGCAADKQGHGTHCAGTAAGAAFGVAPAATIRSVKVLSDSGGGAWSWLYAALDWLATSDVRPAVASLSLGGYGRQPGAEEAVDAASNAGVVVVVAAGNSNMDACMYSPAFVPSAVTVGSTQIKYSRDRRSSFSNHGDCTNIWAPGSDIKSAGHRSDTGTATMSGTSMACPHVAGGAALVLEDNPDFSRDEVLDILLANGRVNFVTGLYAYDENTMLYVGGDAPLPPGDVTLPPPEHPGTCNRTFSFGPYSDGDCECYGGDYPLLCYDNGRRGCPYYFSGRSVQYFVHTCTTCECK